MTDRAIFNRRYTGFTPGSTQVWLANGAGVTTSPTSTQSFTAGSALSQGTVVYVSGIYAFPASAASGVTPQQYTPIGITAASAALNSGVTVVLSDIAVINSSNLVGETSLTPGAYYYLSRYTGKLTKYSTSSGLVTAPSGYAALVNLGTAVSPSELQVEIQPSVALYDEGFSTAVTAPFTQNLTASTDLVQGSPVFVSGVYAVPASAASGVPSADNNVIGLTASAASASSTVAVVLDDIATVSDGALTADTVLVPGQYYYLSKYRGELVGYTTASGTVSVSGGYGVLVNLGIALSPTELLIQVQPPLGLYLS